jgi:hypothetical protein
MTDVRLVATNPDDSSLVPVASNSRGELLTQAPKIELISNDVEINGELTVTGDLTVTGVITGDGGKGEPGEPGKDGEGVPLPYGEDGTFLGIVDGAPQWIPLETPVVNPGPFLFTDPSLPPGDQYGPAIWDSEQEKYDGTEQWDDYLRTLPCWDNPESTSFQGVGTQWTRDFRLKFLLENQLGDILRLHIRFQCSTSAAGSNATVTVEPTDDSNIVVIDNERSISKGGGETIIIDFDATFLLNRANLGAREFDFSKVIGSYQGGNEYFVCTSYHLEDSSTFLMKEYVQMKSKINDVKQAAALIRPK